MSQKTQLLLNEPTSFQIKQETLIKFLFEDKLTPEEANEIVSLAQFQTFEPGEVILAEGAHNTKLFFLTEGTINIIHGGEKIATISEVGQILGELSLITGKTCQASSIVETRASCIVVDLERTSRLSPRLQELFKHSLNHLFSLFLAEKLALTNEKARLFEITNRELKKAQKSLEAASGDRINDLTRNQRKILQTLDTLVDTELKDIQIAIESLVIPGAESLSALYRDRLGTLSKKVQKLIREIRPFSEIFRKEHSLLGKRILVAEEDPNEQINIWMSLGGTGVELTMISDLESGYAALTTGTFDVICFTQAFLDLVPVSRAAQSSGTKYIFMTSTTTSEQFKILQSHPEISTILARDPEDTLFTVKNTSTTVQKLLTDDIFGVEKYLNWGTELQEHTITHSGQREELIDKMTEYFDSLGIKRALQRKYKTIAEEMLMNAIYDAPTDTQGKSLYNHLDRTVPIILKPNEYGRFRYGFDGKFLAVSVVDHFGSLSRSIVLDYFSRCYAHGVSDTSIEGKGGGGNGLFLIIQSSSLVIFNISPGQKTEVISLINTETSADKTRRFPTFYFFEMLS